MSVCMNCGYRVRNNANKKKLQGNIFVHKKCPIQQITEKNEDGSETTYLKSYMKRFIKRKMRR